MDSETSQPSTELNTPAPPTKDQDNRRHSAEDHPCPTPETDHPTKPAPNQLHSRKIEASGRVRNASTAASSFLAITLTWDLDRLVIPRVSTSGPCAVWTPPAG